MWKDDSKVVKNARSAKRRECLAVQHADLRSKMEVTQSK